MESADGTRVKMHGDADVGAHCFDEFDPIPQG